MTPFEEDVLFLALGQARAWTWLHDPQASGHLNAEQILELCKDAGFSEEAAQKAATRRGYERMKRELPA